MHADETRQTVAAQSLEWRVINDNVMGGRSLGTASVAGEVLSFSGSLNTNGGGFASIRVSARDLLGDDAAGMRLKVRGDGRTYTFRLRPKNSRISYWSLFATEDGKWLEVTLPFASFWPNWRGRRLNAPAITAGEVAELGLMINDGVDGAFALEVDWIATY
jgi:hypothetical protein